jgi:hypothetical protein
MLVEMDKGMLSALIKGCDPTYESMDHPLIKSKGYYSGGHNDRWNWNSSFGDCTEEQLWETYQLLQNPAPYKESMRYHNDPCSAHELYNRLYALSGVEFVLIEDHMNLSVTITVVGGKDEEVARVLASSLASCVKTIGNYQVCSETMIPWKFLIYRSYPYEPNN